MSPQVSMGTAVQVEAVHHVSEAGCVSRIVKFAPLTFAEWTKMFRCTAKKTSLDYQPDCALWRLTWILAA